LQVTHEQRACSPSTLRPVRACFHNSGLCCNSHRHPVRVVAPARRLRCTQPSRPGTRPGGYTSAVAWNVWLQNPSLYIENNRLSRGSFGYLLNTYGCVALIEHVRLRCAWARDYQRIPVRFMSSSSSDSVSYRRSATLQSCGTGVCWAFPCTTSSCMSHGL
jgi:hypothetical protein